MPSRMPVLILVYLNHTNSCFRPYIREKTDFWIKLFINFDLIKWNFSKFHTCFAWSILLPKFIYVCMASRVWISQDITDLFQFEYTHIKRYDCRVWPYKCYFFEVHIHWSCFPPKFKMAAEGGGGDYKYILPIQIHMRNLYCLQMAIFKLKIRAWYKILVK